MSLEQTMQPLQVTAQMLFFKSHNVLIHGFRLEGPRFQPVSVMAPKKNRSGPSGWKKLNAKKAHEARVRAALKSRGSAEGSARGTTQDATEHKCKATRNKYVPELATASSSKMQATKGGEDEAQLTEAQKSTPTAQEEMSDVTSKPPTQAEDSKHTPASVGSRGKTVDSGVGDRSVQVQDACVGEHITGEPFLWKGIFDME